jgi:predicted aspartyl protease
MIKTTMSITYLNVAIQNPQKPTKKAVGHFLVDSGAVYSVVPARELKKLGITPSDTQKFSLANGEVIEKGVGNALFSYGGKVRSSPVVFGEEGIYLLGAVTLESLGVILDPINRELKPLPMLM